MSESLTTLLAQPVTLESSYAWSVTDQGGAGRTVTIPVGVYRLLLASVASGAGTVAAPWETLTKFQALINAGAGGGNPWAFSLQSTGLVRIQYNGAGTGTLNFDGAGVTRKLLGWASGISTTTGGYLDGAYLPTHAVFAFNRAGDTGWVSVPRPGAWAVMPTGVVYGWQGATARQTRQFTLRFHPTDWTQRTALSSLATPLYPDDESRIRTPTATPGVSYPWSIHDFVRTAGGLRLGAALGTLQARISGTGTFDEAYLLPEALTADGATRLSVANWSQRTDWADVALSRYRETSSA
jgi:hypothetical protein